MNFGKFFERKKPEAHSKNMEEIYRIKKSIETEDRIFEEELAAKYSLLHEFSIDNLKKLCDERLGGNPPSDDYVDPASGMKKPLPQFKEDYIHHIVDEMRLAEIKEYALERKIVSPKFFKN